MRQVSYPKPGEILLEEFLKPMGITQYRLAKEIGCHSGASARSSQARAITADTGLRLAKFFGTSEGFWITLQSDYEREMAKDQLAGVLAEIRPWSEVNKAA